MKYKKKIGSLCITTFFVLMAIFVVIPGSVIAPPTHTEFTEGDVFVAVGGGQVYWYLPDGTFNMLLTPGVSSLYATGMTFDADDNLYVTMFGAKTVCKFDKYGVYQGEFGSSATVYGSNSPESIVYDAYGDFYVGTVDGSSNDVFKLNATGDKLAQYDVAIDDRGSDWIELGSDQCTLYYTSEAYDVMRYDVCTDTQLTDFNTAPLTGRGFALRLLPSGHLLVAASETIIRLDAAGNVFQTYDTPTPGDEDGWFALNIDPDGKTFWSASYDNGNVYRFDIATGDIITTFNTGMSASWGLAVFGETPSVIKPPVWPNVVEETVCPCDILEIEKTIRTPDIPQKLDLLILEDETGSFADDIIVMQGTEVDYSDGKAAAIWNGITAHVADFQGAVAGFRDFNQSTWGTWGDWVYTLYQDFTSDRSTWLTNGIGSLSAGGGSDYPEAQLGALKTIADGSAWDSNGDADTTDDEDTGLGENPTWRADATKIVVLVTDAPYHLDTDDGNAYPGPSYADTVSALNAEGIHVIALVTPGAGLEGIYASLTADTNGTVKNIADDSSDIVEAILEALEELSTDVWWEFCPITELDIDLDPTVIEDVPGDTAVTFTETIEIPCDAEEGTYTNTITFLADTYDSGQGIVVGTQDIIIHVEPCYEIEKYYTHTDVNFNPWHWEYETLLFEDFSDCLTGWTKKSGTEINWDCNDSDYAGGTAYEARLNWSPPFEGNTWLRSPSFSTVGMDSVNVSYKQFVDHFSRGFKLKVDAKYSGGSWTTVENTRYTADSGPETKSIMLPDEFLDKSNVKIRFKFQGDILRIDRWYIDNVTIIGGYKVMDPAELGTTLEEIELVINHNKVKSTNPGQLYAVVNLTGPIEEGYFRDVFDIEFDVNPAKIGTGGVQVIILNSTGYATVVTDTPWVTILGVNTTRDGQLRSVDIAFDFPPGEIDPDDVLKVYIKFQTAYKNKKYGFDDENFVGSNYDPADDEFWDNAKFWDRMTPRWTVKTGRIELPIIGVPS
jgi:hypothetical protein